MWKITLGKIFLPLLGSIKTANKDQTSSLVLTSILLKLQKNRKKCNSQSYGKHRHDQEITSVWKTFCLSWPMHMLNSIRTHRGKETPLRSPGPSFTWWHTGPCFQSPVNGKDDTEQWAVTWDLTKGKNSSCCVSFNTHYGCRKGILSRDTCLLFCGNVLTENVWVYLVQFSSVTESCPTLPSHGLQQNRLPYPSLSPGDCPNLCPSSQWYHPAISPSVFPFSCLKSFPASGSFSMSQFSALCRQSIGASALATVLPMNIKDWFPFGLTGLISLQSKGLSRVFSNTTVPKHQFFITQLSLWSKSHIHTWLLEKP